MFEELKELGLTDNEIKIYEILLKFGPLKPAEISQKLGQSRPYIYDSLERLEEKQIVSTLTISNKRAYQATSPEKLREIMRTKLEKIETLIPRLINLTKLAKEDIKVELYKGKNIMSQNLLKDIISALKKGDEVLVFGIEDKKLMQEDKYYETNLKIYLEKIKRLGIKERILVKKGIELQHIEKTTRYKYLPEESFGNVTFQLYSDKVAIILWGTPNHLILIKNKEVTQSYKKQFEIMWSTAKVK